MQINISSLDRLIATLVCNIKLHPRKQYDDTVLENNGKSIFNFLKQQLSNVQSLEIPDQDKVSVAAACDKAIEHIKKSNDTSLLYDVISEIESKITDLAFVDEIYNHLYSKLILMGFNDFTYGIFPWKVKIGKNIGFNENDVISELVEWNKPTLPIFEYYMEKYQFGLSELIDSYIGDNVVINSIEEMEDNLHQVWKKIVYLYSPTFRDVAISKTTDLLINMITYADYGLKDKTEIIQSWSDKKYIDDFITDDVLILALNKCGFIETRDSEVPLLEQLYDEAKVRFYQEPDVVINPPIKEIKREEDILALYENPEVTIWEFRAELIKICHKKSKLDIRRVLYLYLTKQSETFVKFENVYCLSKKECVGVLVHYWLMKR